jgi:hypothetical protein
LPLNHGCSTSVRTKGEQRSVIWFLWSERYQGLQSIKDQYFAAWNEKFKNSCFLRIITGDKRSEESGARMPLCSAENVLL